MSGSWRPVSTRELRRLALRLEASAYCRTVLTNELRNLLKQPEYCDWLAKGRLAAEPYRGQVPEALISLGLAPLENGLGLQVQFLNNSLFLMDTPAQESVPIQERVEPQDRYERAEDGYYVYPQLVRDTRFLMDTPAEAVTTCVDPYEYESERINECVEAHALYEWAELVVDLACGCGRRAITWPSTAPRLLFDNRERALAYAKVNALLNEVGATTTIAEHDIRQGIPPSVQGTKRTVVLANMPFSLSPIPELPRSTLNGDHTGASLTLAALGALGEHCKSIKQPLRAVVLCCTVGKSAEGPWEVVDKAVQLFGPEAVKFDHLTTEMIRIDGPNRYSVPATTRQIADAAKCRPGAPFQEQSQFRKGYQNLIEVLNRDGWGFVGYGTLCLDLPACSKTA